MNCKVESMKENCKNHVDTLPPRGRVNEVRREWLVHEDGALAYRLQDEEIKQHLIGNRSRNIQIREDFPRAKDEQQREAEEAVRLHQQLLLQQEQQDAKIAIQLARHIEKEEEERKKILEEEDKELARLLQEQEQWKVSKRERDLRELETHTPKKDKYFCEGKRSPMYQRAVPQSSYSEGHSSSRSSYYYDNNLSDINNVGLPLQDDIVQPLRNCNLNGQSSYRPIRDNSPQYLSEDEARRIQEEKDEKGEFLVHVASKIMTRMTLFNQCENVVLTHVQHKPEYARYLQEKENMDTLDTVTRDRLLAIETQDKELARLLQEKERAKAKRARERAKQRAALKRMQEESGETGGEVVLERENVTIKTAETVTVNCQRNVDGESLGHREATPSSSTAAIPQPESPPKPIKSKPRYPDPEEIVELPPEETPTTSSTHANIAATIDPTYTRESLERNARSKKCSTKGSSNNRSSGEFHSASAILSHEDITTDGNPPPYMPIQGQRRLPEKKPKQKDGCKQQ